MKNLLLMFLSYIIFSETILAQQNDVRNVQAELEEFMKSRNQVFEKLLSDQTIFDERAREMIKKLMERGIISNNGLANFRLNYTWDKNVLTLHSLSDKDQLEIQVIASDVIIKGVHFQNLNGSELRHLIEQRITIPQDLVYKNHEISFDQGNLKIILK